jgi:hypothetical protein
MDCCCGFVVLLRCLLFPDFSVCLVALPPSRKPSACLFEGLLPAQRAVLKHSFPLLSAAEVNFLDVQPVEQTAAPLFNCGLYGVALLCCCCFIMHVVLSCLVDVTSQYLVSVVRFTNTLLELSLRHLNFSSPLFLFGPPPSFFRSMLCPGTT